MGIDFKINIKRRIKINGKEYGSLEEVPLEFRKTVQDALGAAGTPGSRGKITVNGVSYDSAEAMPQDVRLIYERSLKKAEEAGEDVSPGPARFGLTEDLKPEGAVSWKTIIVFLLAGAALLLFKFLH